MNQKSKKKSLRNLSSVRQPRRLHFFRAAVVGLLASTIAIAFQACIEFVRSGITQITQPFESFILLKGLIVVLFCTISGLIAGLITEKFAPEAGGSGIPSVKAVLLHFRELRFGLLLPVKFLGGVLAIGSGFSLGREGPTVHLGAALASAVSKVMKVPPRSRNHLIACGAGAGLAAAFNAPLAGFLFVIEELRRELSPITYGAAFIAAVVADGIVRLSHGPSPSLMHALYGSPPATTFPIIIIIGLVMGSCGAMFNKSLQSALKHFPPSISLWKRGAFTGLVIAIFTILIPNSTTTLQGILDKFLQPSGGASIALWAFGAYFLIKFGLTILSYVSGVPGGIFAPMLAQGALLGVFIGKIAEQVLSITPVPAGVYGIIGMAGFFSASVRAPLTGVVLISEMTGDFNLLFLLLVASLISYLVAEAHNSKPIYEALLDLDLQKLNPTVTEEKEPVIVDLIVEPGSKMHGLQVRKLKLQRGCIMITVRHKGREIIPHRETIIYEGDQIAFLVDPNALGQIPELRNAASTPTHRQE